MVMSLAQSARLNGQVPFAYFSDVLRRLPTQLNSRLEELLPHRWQPRAAGRRAHRVKNIEALFDDGGDITVGPISPVSCAATADDGKHPLAMLVRRDAKPVSALFKRLDRTIARHFETG